jgi:hypothetical protein
MYFSFFRIRNLLNDKRGPLSINAIFCFKIRKKGFYTEGSPFFKNLSNCKTKSLLFGLLKNILLRLTLFTNFSYVI